MHVFNENFWFSVMFIQESGHQDDSKNDNQHIFYSFQKEQQKTKGLVKYFDAIFYYNNYHQAM